MTRNLTLAAVIALLGVLLISIHWLLAGFALAGLFLLVLVLRARPDAVSSEELEIEERRRG